MFPDFARTRPTRRFRPALLLLAAGALTLLLVSSADAWRAPSDFENKVAAIISKPDSQGSREPNIVASPDGSLLAVWSDQFVMKFARDFPGQGPEYKTWTVSDIPGSAVPTGTPNDTSKPAIAVQGNEVAVAYLFNFNRTSGTGQQHDVVLITGHLAAGAPGITWDQASPTRITSSDTDNAQRVSVAIDTGGNVELAWQDNPDGAPSVIRYLEVGSGNQPVVISNPSVNATWPVLAVDEANRLHVAYTENGQVVERFAEAPGFGQSRVFGNPTLLAGSGAARPDLAILPSGSGGAGVPIVVYEASACSGTKTEVFAVAPGVAPTQLSSCTATGNQSQATVAIRASDRTVYAVWTRQTAGFSPAGPLEESRLVASNGWSWWTPVEIVPTEGSGFLRAELAANDFGEMVIDETLTTTAASGEEVAALSDQQLPTDATGVTATAATGGGVKLSWDPAPSDDYQGLKILRKATDSFSGPNDPTATMVGQFYAKLALVNGSYAVTTPLPTTMTDTTADSSASYVYRLYFSHRGPTPATNFNQSPGYRFGTSVAYGTPPPPPPVTPIPAPPIYEVGVPQVHTFTATAGDGRVDLAWTLPFSQFDNLQLVRKAGGAPTGPTDGTLLLTSATATSYADTAVTNGTTYFYAVYVKRGTDYSTPARAVATPNPPNAPFTYISQPAGDYSGTGAGYTLGALFHVTTAKALLKLGKTYAPGSFAGNQIGIWDASNGTLLASLTISPTSPSVALAQPLILQANHPYVIGIKEQVGSPWSPNRPLIALPPYLVVDDSAFGVGSLMTYPDQRDGKPGYSNEDWTMTLGPTDSLSLTPPDPPANLLALPGNARVDLQWQNPGDFDSVQVVRKVGSAPANSNDGSVVYSGTGTSFTDFQVTDGTTYYYGVFSVRRGQPSTTGAQASATPGLPAGAVSYTAVPHGTYDQLSTAYTAGAVFHVTSDKLLFELGRVYPSGATNSNQIGIWDSSTGSLLYSTTVSAAAPVAELANPLLLHAGTQYVIGVKETGPWSSSRLLTGLPSFLVVDDSAFTSTGTFSYPSGRDKLPGHSNDDWLMTFGTPGGLPVSGLRAVADDGRVNLSWTNPPDVGVVTVVRKAGGLPASPTDGTLVYSGTGIGVTDAGLTNGTPYGYGVWIQRSGGYSAAAQATATPQQPDVPAVTALAANSGDGQVSLSWTNPGPTVMAALGDSVTTGGSIDSAGADSPNSSWSTGSDPSDGVSSQYERLLAAKPGIAGHNFNFAVSGAPMSAIAAQADQAVAAAADYVTIEAGTNDVCGPTDTPITTLSDFRTQFASALQRINNGRPNASIFVASIPDWTQIWTLFSSNDAAKAAWAANNRCPRILGSGVTDADRAAIRARIQQFNQILMEQCAAATNCRFDMGAVFGTTLAAADVSTTDYFHPSRAGQALLADTTWATGFWPDLASEQIEVVRKADAQPASPTDGTMVYTGQAESFNDTTVANGTNYQYGVWVVRGSRTSTAARVGAAPSQLVTYATQPSGDFARTESTYNLGTVFHVTQDRVLLKLGRAYAAGSTASNRIGVWDGTTGTLLASATINPLSPVAALSTPLALTAGTSYVIGVSESSGSPWSNPRPLTGLPGFLVVDDTAYNTSSTFSYPALRDHQPAPIKVADSWSMTFGPPGSGPLTLPDAVSDLVASPADGSVALTWTNPTSTFDRIDVVRKVGAPPANVGDGTLVYSGSASSFTDTALTDGTLYDYAVWVERGGQLSPARVVSATPTGLTADPVTNLQASAGDGRVDLSWANPTSPFDRVDVVRKTGSTPSSRLDGTLVYSGSASTYADTALTNGTLYFYAVWVERGGTISAAVRVAAAPAIGPVPAVTGVQALPGDTRVDLSWTNPSAPFDAVQVVRKVGSAPADPTDGTTVYSGTGSTVADSGLVNGTLYFYAVWTVKSGQLSSPVRTSATPAVPAPNPVTGLQATAGDRRVDLAWTSPAGLYDSVIVVRKTGSTPTSPSDGTVVFEGNTTTAADAGLTDGTVYNYAAWAQRGGVLSPAARVSAVPAAPTAIVSYTAQPTGTYTGTSPSYTLGTVFHLTQDRAIVTLGRVFAAGSTAANQIGIWDEASGALLYSGVVSPASPTLTLPSPLVLTASKRYVLGIKEAAGSPWSSSRTLTGLPSFLVIDDTAWVAGTTLTNPTGRDGKPGQSNEDWTMSFGPVSSAPVAPDPVSGVTATPGDTTVALSWANPATAFDQVEVVRKAGSTPTDPTDGTVVYSGTATSATDVGLTDGVTYQYAIWTTGNGLLSPAVRTSATPTNAPPGPVTGLTASAGDGQVVLAWTNPPGTFDAVDIVRKLGSAPTSATDGTTVYTGTASAFTDSGLSNGTSYFYGVWVARGGLLSTPAQANATPVAAPLAPVTGLTATPADMTVTLAWANPTAPFDFVQVVRKQGGVPTSPTDGTTVYTGTGTSVTDTGLVDGTAYSYAVWAERSGRLSPPVTVAAVPAAPPLTSVIGLTAKAKSFDVDLSWTNPSFRFDRIDVVRKAGADPTGVGDGTLVYAGTGTSLSDAGLSNGTTYHYAVFVERDGAVSAPALTKATPIDPAANVSYTATPAGTYTGTGGGFNLGATFHVTQTKVVLSVGRVYKAGSTAGNQIGIWDGTTGALLASATVSPAAPVASFNEPPILTAGKQYVIGVKENTGSPWSTARTLTGLPSFLVIDDTAFNSSSTFSYPSQRDNKPGQSNEDWAMTFGAVGTAPAPDPVSGLAASAGDSRIDLSWSNPTTPFASIVVVRKQGADPAGPTDGTVVYTGTGSSLTDTGLTNGTSYHYGVWTQSLGQTSTAALVSATPVASTPGPATGFTAAGGDGQVTLGWTNPTTAFDDVVVVRKTGSDPANPGDGTLVYTGTASSATDGGLADGTTYRYGIWAEHGGVLSTPAYAAATTSSVVSYTVQPTGDFSQTDSTFNIGAVFHVTADKTLLALGRAYAAGSTGSNVIGVFDATTKTLLASATVTPQTPNAALSTPVALTAGTQYVIGIKESTGSPWSAARVPTGLPSFLVLDDTSYNRDTAFDFPNLRDGQSPPIKLAEDWRMTFGLPGAPPLVLPTPVSGLVATPGDGSVSLAWQNPTTPFTEIDVVRKIGSAPSSAADGTLVYTGTGATFVDTGLTNGQLVYYGVWVRTATDSSSESVASATPTGVVPDPVTNLQATAGNSQVALSWADPTSPFDQVEIVRKAGAAPANPTDGTAVYTGTGTSYNDSALTNGTLYFYAVWVQRGTSVSSAARVAATPSLAPVPPVTNLVGTPGDGQVALSWTPPALYDAIEVVRKAGTSPPADPSDGTLVFDGRGNLTLDTGLTNGSVYQYGVWVSLNGRLSSPSTVSATPAVSAPDPITGFTAAPGDGSVALSWTNPATPFDGVTITRKAGSPPTSPTDGTVVFDGTGTAAADTGLTDGTLYYYGAWTTRGGAVSAAARAATVPTPASGTTTYSTQPAGDHANSTAGYMLGVVFHVTQPEAILGVGRVYSTGSTGANQIGVWDEQTQTLVASTTVSPSTPTATLATAVVLQPGRRYVLGIKQSSGSPWSTARTLTGLPSFLMLDDTAYATSSTFTYPALRDNQTAPIKVADDWTMTFAPVAAAPAPPDPVSGLQAAVSDGRVDLQWTNPGTPFDQVEVVRKAGAAPADPGDGTLVYTGSASSAADVGLTNGTVYDYAVWTVKNGVLSLPARITATPQPTPPSSVTGVVANPGDGQVVLSWTNPIGSFDRIDVVRKTGGAPSGPTDGTPVYSGVGSSVTDTGLTNGTLYQYGIWVERSGLLSPATLTSATPVAAPLDPVSSLKATPGDLRVDLSWTNPTTPFDQILVVRKAGADPTAPTDGTTVFSGTQTSLSDTGLTNGVDYHYAVWAQRSGRLSAVARVTATPVAPPLVGVTGLQATAGNTTVSLTWTNPAIRFDQVVVVRKVGSDPTGPTDGAAVYSGSGSSVTDALLTNGTTYRYAVFVQRDGSTSTAALAQATPLDLTSVLSYTASPTGTYANVNGTYTTGAAFHVTDPKVVTKLGRVYRAGSSGTNQVGIWDASTGTLLGSVTITATQPTAPLATPVSLQVGKQYVIGVKENATDPWSSARVLTNLPGFLVIDDTAFAAGSSFTYPNGRDGKTGQSNEDWTMTFAASGAPTAPGAVTGLTAAWNDSRIDLTWTNPPAPFDVVEVVRKAGSDPVDPTDGTVVFSGVAGSFSDTGLTNGVAYHYGLWVVRGGQLSPVARVTSTPNVPVAPITGLQATPGDLRVDLSWTNPVARFDRVDVVRKAGSAPTSPTDGTLVYSGTGTSVSDTGLTNGTVYDYAVWVERDGLLSFTPARATATPVAPPLVTVSALKATPGNGSATVSWTNPTIRFDRIVIVRKAGGAPATETDGTTVYTGTGTSVADTGLTNGTNYVYAAFVERDGAVSSAATVGVTPFDPASVITYSAQPVGDFAGTGGGLTLGSAFHVTDAKVVLTLGRAYKSGSTGTNQVGLWDASTGVLLGSVTVSPASPTADLATPVALQPGKQYVIGVGETATAPWSHARVMTGLPGFLVVDDTAFVASSFGYPNGRDGKAGQSNEDWLMRFAAAGTVTTPDPVTGLHGTAGDGKATLAWTNPPTSFDVVQVVRKAGGVPTGPSDGTLVYSGAGASFVDTGLTNGAAYGYAVWTVRGGQASAAATTTVTPRGAGVSGLTATPADLSVALTWTNPTTPFDSIEVVRTSGPVAPATPTDGTAVFNGTASTYTDTGLTNGSTYSYAVWAVRAGVLSATATATATPAPPALAAVSNVRATPSNGEVDLSWSNPTGRFDRVVVVRKIGADPATPSDGTLVYSGTGTTLSDTGLTNGIEYHYGLWVQRDTDQSTPVFALAIPADPNAVVTYTAAPTGGYTGTAANFVLGGVFHVTDPKAITRLGRAYKAGSTAGNTIGIWDAATGSLLTSVTVTPTAPVVTLATPLTLQVGKQYVIGVQEAAGTPWSSARTLTNMPGFLVVDDTAFVQSTSLAYPSGRDNKPGQSNEDWVMSFAPIGQVSAPDPATGFAASGGDGKVSLSWTNPTTPFDLVELVRKAGGAPSSPSDGTTVFSGVGSSFVDTTVTNGTTYGYALWVVRAGVTSTAARATVTPAPPPVTNLQASASDGTVALTWTNPTGPFTAVTVVRKVGADPSTPTDGTVVYTGTGTSVTDTGLTNGTAYHYAVWVTHGTDLSAAARVSATPDVAAPAPVANLAATVGDGTVNLSWTNPSGSFDSLTVVRKSGSDPGSPSDGTVVYTGTATSVVDTGLVNGTSYHYGVWVSRGDKLSTPAYAAATPNPGAVPSVTGLTASAGNGTVALAWTNPATRFDQIVVVRKVGSDPTGVVDGTSVYTGTATSATDATASNGVAYHYAVFVSRDGAYDGGAFVTAVPLDPATIVTYTSTPAGSYANALPGFVLGAVFHVTQPEYLLTLGRAYAAGSTAGNTIGVWDTTGPTLIASVSVTPGAPVATLKTPVLLQANRQYALGILEASGSPWSPAHLLTGLPAFLIIDDTAYIGSTTLAYPSQRDNKPGQSNEDWVMSFGPAAP